MKQCSFLPIGSLDMNIFTFCDIVLEESEFLPEPPKLCKTSNMELFAKLVNGFMKLHVRCLTEF